MKTTFLKHSIIIALVAFIATANAQIGKQNHYISSSHSYGNNYMYVDDDSSVNPVLTTVAYRDGHDSYDIKLADDKLVELYVNNRKIPADSFYVYNGMITKLKEQIKKDRIQAIEDRKQAEFDRTQAGKDREQAGEDQKQAERDRLQAEEDRKQAELDRLEAVKDQQQAVKDREQAELDRKQAELDREQAGKDQIQAGKDREQAEVDRKQAEEDRKMVKALVDEIVKQNIVPDEKSVRHVTLNDDEFTVNGKKQSEELHAKFKALFLKKPGYNITYGGYTSGYGIYINNQ